MIKMSSDIGIFIQTNNPQKYISLSKTQSHFENVNGLQKNTNREFQFRFERLFPNKRRNEFL